MVTIQQAHLTSITTVQWCTCGGFSHWLLLVVMNSGRLKLDNSQQKHCCQNRIKLGDPQLYIPGRPCYKA